MTVDGVLAAPPDPRAARTAADLVAALGDLRLWAGQPSLRTLRRLGGSTVTVAGVEIDALPVSTTSHLLNGHGLPRAPRMEFVEAFVGACLRSAGRDDAAVAREVERWRAAWSAVARYGSTVDDHEPAGPPSPPPAPDPLPGPAPVVAVASPGSVAAAGSATFRPRPRWRLALAAATAGAVAATGATLWLQRDGDAAGPATAAVPVHRDGTITGLRDIDGLDLDTGEVTQQNAPGTDLSPWGRANHVVTRTSAMVLLLDEPGTEAYERCADAPVAGRVVQLNGLHGLAAGRNLCVWTTDQRVAMLTLTTAPGPREGTLSFRYVVWQP